MMISLNMHLILLLMFFPTIFGFFNSNCSLEQDERWNITWSTTTVGGIAIESCPGGSKTNGSATRECVDHNSWADPSVSECMTIELQILRQQAMRLSNCVQSNSDTGTVMCRMTNPGPVETLLSITADTHDIINTTVPILPNDIPVILDILRAVLDVTRHGRQMFVMEPQSTDIAENCAMIIDIMLDERQDDSFEAVTEQMQSVSEQLLRITERVGILVAITFNTSQDETLNHTFTGSHIIIDALLPSDDDLMNSDNFMFQRRMLGRNNAPLPGIRIPSRVVQNRGNKSGEGRRGRIPIVSIFILNLESKLQNDEGQETVSAILSTQISNNDTEDEDGDLDDEEIELMIDIGMLDFASSDLRCVFWSFSRDGEAGGFSEEGITQGSITDDNTLSCFSTHLTSFAVLVDATGPGDTSYSASTPALSIVSYVGCGISIVCLSLSILLLLMFRKRIFNQVRHFIHVNLSAALLSGLIVFVSGIEAASDFRAGCLTVAILLHYFFLAAFSWMLCEALVLLIVVEFVFYEGFFNSRKFFALLGWGLPVPIVAISAAVSYEQYGINGRCWISKEEGAIWAFLGPMLLIILINSIVYIIIVYQVFKSKHDGITVDKAGTVESVKTSLKAAVILMPLLGMTWLFGLLMVNDDTIAFAWIFTILNSLQGFFIFLFYVIKNKKFLSMLKKHSARLYTSKSGTELPNKTSTLNSSEDKSKAK